jgi:hypothetical protein
MGETSLRALFSHAVSAEPPPERPLGRIVADSRGLGGRLRRRRRTESAIASVASVAVVAVVVSFASGAFGHTRNQGPAGFSARSRQMAYVLTTLGRQHGYGAVVPVNLATMRASRPLQSTLQGILTYGNEIVAARGGKTLYVSTSRGVILPISTATGKAGRAVRVPGEPLTADDLLAIPSRKLAYAVGSGVFTPVDLLTGTALKPISVPIADEDTASISVSRNSKTVVTVGDGQHSATTVATVINVASQRMQRPISIEGGLDTTCAAVSPDGAMGYVYASRKQPFVVIPIDIAANRALKPIKLPRKDYGPNTDMCSMAVAPNGRTAYVLIGQYVVPIDLANGRVMGPIKLRGLFPFSPQLGIDPDGRMAYALGLRGVTPIDLATNKALPTISFGDNFSPYCLVFSPTGSTALVGIGGPHNSGKLVLIRAATGKVVKTIRMPSIPASIVVTPGG